MAPFLAKLPIRLRATTDKAQDYAKAQVMIVTNPTDYEPESNDFNTDSVQDVLADAHAFTPTALAEVKSAVSVNFTQSMREKLALRDKLYPNSIVVGERSDRHGIGTEIVRCITETGSKCFADEQHKRRGDQAVLRHLLDDAVSPHQRAEHQRHGP